METQKDPDREEAVEETESQAMTLQLLVLTWCQF